MMNIKGKCILICSDTHGRTEFLERVLKQRQYDAMFFLGDGEGLENQLADISGCPAELYLVKGNNDYNYALPESAVVEAGTHRIYLTHGHRYHLYMGYVFLENAAREKNCDYCFFGHLHKPLQKTENGIVFLNPGSLSEPRQTPHIPTCAVLECDENGDFKIGFLNALDLTAFEPEQCH